MSFFSGLFKGSDHPIGKSLTFGHYKVTILKLIAEGGYGYVYLARDQQNERVFYALKKLLVRAEIAELTQQEIDIMRSTRHKNVVTLLETSTISIPNSSEKEVFMLMEFCSGGTAAELTAQRALNETEILRIFSDVCEAVAQLHLREPPVAHRDLKLENVLLHPESGSYKLCDFGSCRAGQLRVGSKPEMLQAEEEIQKFTTPAYRAPEMVDLYSGHVINERVDLWALGCVLYKLCFRVTPFDDGEQPLQILNVQYTIPSNNFAAPILQLISKCLCADPLMRPDIWSVFKKVCKLRQVPNTMERPRNRPKVPKPQMIPQVDLRSSPGIPASMLPQPSSLGVTKQTNYKHRRGKSVAEDAMAAPFPFHAQSQPASTAVGAPVAMMPQQLQHSIAQPVPTLMAPSPLSISPTQFAPPQAPMTLDPIPDLTSSTTMVVTAQSLYQGGAVRVFDSLSKRPIGGDAIVCLKALLCLDMVFLEGHPMCVQDGIKNVAVLNHLHTHWANQRDTNPYAAAAICQYCKLLVKKLQFHQQHPEIEGNYSLDRYFQMADARGVILPVGDGHPMSKDTIAQLFDILSNVVAFFGLLGDMNLLAASPMNAWVLSTVLPLVQEAYDIFLTSSFLTWKLMFVEQAPIFTQMQSNFAGVYGNMQQLWATLAKVPAMPQIVTLPPLPPSIPIFNGTKVAPLQPPRSAQSRAGNAASVIVASGASVVQQPSFNPFTGTSSNDFGKPSQLISRNPSAPADAMAQLVIGAPPSSSHHPGHRRAGSLATHSPAHSPTPVHVMPIPSVSTPPGTAPIVVHLPQQRMHQAQANIVPAPASPSRARTQAPASASPQRIPVPSAPQRTQSSSTLPHQPVPVAPQSALMPPPEPKVQASGHRRSQSSVAAVDAKRL